MDDENNNNENNENNKLDDDWINNFEKTDELYQDFYKDDLYYINLKFFYINKFSEIEKIKNEIFYMSMPNYISREEIIGILKHTAKDNDIHYSLLSILKYTIHLEPEDVKKLINKSLKDKIKVNATELNYFPKPATLEIDV